jgi:hypothetical protein
MQANPDECELLPLPLNHNKDHFNNGHKGIGKTESKLKGHPT